MPQLDFLIWFLLTTSTTVIFWIVYMLTLWIYRKLILSQCFILKLKNFIIFFFNSVLHKIILLLKFFFRTGYLFNEYFFFLQHLYNNIKFVFFFNLVIFFKLHYNFTYLLNFYIFKRILIAFLVNIHSQQKQYSYLFNNNESLYLSRLVLFCNRFNNLFINFYKHIIIFALTFKYNYSFLVQHHYICAYKNFIKNFII